jgi:hypothetical protein
VQFLRDFFFGSFESSQALNTRVYSQNYVPRKPFESFSPAISAVAREIFGCGGVKGECGQVAPQ